MFVKLAKQETVPTPRSTRAPAELSPTEWMEVQTWAERRVPWIERDALESLTPLDDYVDACLNYFHGKKTMRPNWVGTVRNWIRREERSRLERMAKAGNASARLALRDPVKWKDGFDNLSAQAPTSDAEQPLLTTNTSGNSISLTRRQ